MLSPHSAGPPVEEGRRRGDPVFGLPTACSGMVFSSLPWEVVSSPSLEACSGSSVNQCFPGSL